MKYYHLLLTSVILIASSELSAQDLMYKENDEIIKVNILISGFNFNFFNKSYTPNIYISNRLTDRIIYSNRMREKFQGENISINYKT